MIVVLYNSNKDVISSLILKLAQKAAKFSPKLTGLLLGGPWLGMEPFIAISAEESTVWIQAS